jgi:glycosyltransferase involved in cell wall biosynthesis
MRTVLMVLPDLGYRGAVRQASLVAEGLPRDRFAVRVAALNRPGHLAGLFRDVTVLGGKRRIDPATWVVLRRLAAELRPDVVHAWGPFAGRVAAWAVGASSLVVTDPVPRSGRGAFGWLDRRLFRNVRALVATNPVAAERIVQRGLPAGRVVQIPPGVTEPAEPDRAAVLKELGLPEESRPVVAAGRLEKGAGFRGAVWSFDVLKYVDPKLRLIVFGEGGDRSALKTFAYALGRDDSRSHFPGGRADVPALLGSADVAWVPHLRGGVCAALEAMAAGVPVVAVRNPELAATPGLADACRFVDANDPVGLAKATRDLLDNQAGRVRFAAAGRDLVRRQFAAGTLIERHAGLYDLGK